ncbi:MAG: hypothetical protein IJH48_05590 [Oscillospiraceae bacterium]|nr:hypothetical protein [Oscillospiraceae bacterium]
MLNTQEAIEKVLDALNDDPKVAEGMENDAEGTLRELVGGEVSEQDLANLTRGTCKLFSDKTIAALFLKLLKNKKNRSGLVSLLLKVGGVSLLIKLLGKSKKEDDDESSLLSSLLGSKAGVALLLKLIGRKADDMPALGALLGAADGKEDGKEDGGLLGALLGSVLK